MAEFIFGISKKFDKDYEIVAKILAKPVSEMTVFDRIVLLDIYKTAYHEDGKIEGITSCDSSCAHCQFCQAMRKIAETDNTVICGECYDHAQEQYKLHAKNRHGLNLLIMSSVEFTEEELKRVIISPLTRINSSGETPNVIYAKNMLRLGKVNPMFHIGYFAKNTAPVVRACDEIGKPENVVLIQSSIHIGRPDSLARYFDYTFTVYPDEKTTLAAIARGSSECNGKKCRECGFKCYYGTHKGTDIAELLRTNKKTRAKILASLTI